MQRNLRYKVDVDVSAKAYKSEAAAEAAGTSQEADNLVGIVAAKTLTLPDGRTAGAFVGRVAGEDFDRAVVSTGALEPGNDTYAHEFTHQIGNIDIREKGIMTNTLPEERSSHATLLDYDMAFAKQFTQVRQAARTFKSNEFSLRRRYRAQRELPKSLFK